MLGSIAWVALHRCLAVDGRNGDRGLPNGRPVDSGAFARKTAFHADRLCHAAVMPMARRPYALTKFVEWLKKYAPPEAAGQRDSNQTA
jgi:glycerol transport system substrate-binding protein